MLELGATSTISISKEQDGGVGPSLIFEVSVALEDFMEASIGVVGVCRREVREYLRAIDSFPIEGAVGELVKAAPREFLG
eukprot:CAMPEP_0170565066 /NCGR_PEP_ID=MMETSP0211-20121228/76522_1 /TAXON_ID=311385 /ORGANISM="Pseudokeronopsis sp., Strain OXSARD2" /LENGTH=79 /DNA_ID=CAMNT_0010885357 /DNA_START=57 /DNA_END=293 /DNA_ORIENTATION=-